MWLASYTPSHTVQDASSRVSRDTRDNLIGVIGKARKQANSEEWVKGLHSDTYILCVCMYIGVLSSVGVEDSRQVLRGSAVVGASLLGLYLARRSELHYVWHYLCVHWVTSNLPHGPFTTWRGSLIYHVALFLCFLPLSSQESMFRKVLYPLLGVGLVGGAIYRDRLYAEYREIERHYRSNVAAWQSGGATNLEQNVRSHTEEAIKKESGEASTNLERSIRSQIEAAVRKEAENGRKQN